MTFEEALPVINIELEKRRSKWKLKAAPWLDYDDVAQIIRIHIHKKWHLYDPEKPLTPWVARTIHNQFCNVLRNYYGNIVSPCHRCAAHLPDNKCDIYGEIGNQCPIYKKWFYNKKSAYDIKLPLPLENHQGEVYEMEDEAMVGSFDIDSFHERMHQALKPKEWEVYRILYIEGGDVEQEIGAQYRQIQVYKKRFITIAKEILYENK